MPYFSCYQLTFLSVNLSCRRILRINRIGIRVPNSSPAWGEVAVRPEEGEPAWGEFTYAPAALAAPPLT